ncbi:hypothetical protein [Sphingobacterium sp. IITKGP-BTPF85]|uniref:hypothetical protein n=1 Tax=Sphingobacterium sp. IITKGP-BTPF85 TaxID=1338009 RepID=UPI00038A34A1|nr:hypothetical protein [Sphingobacterium sp. IITKGP-BTPF85]KKX49782.1 hypothetical protein L950_0213865 [Sphingobacterium sp. IITKGP-BTPF85]
MNNKVNGHTGDFIKRQAKKIKKQENISHVQALDKASINAGFKNWKHFLNASKNLEQDISQTKPATIQKVNPYRNLLISAINTLLDKRIISLNGKSSDSENGHIFVELFGYPSVILWQDIGFDELRISVWWKYNHELHPQANLTGNARENFNGSSPLANRIHYKKFVGVIASGWLERSTGKYLQGKNREAIFDVYTRKGEKDELEKQSLQKPKAFGIEGKVYI